MHGTRGCTETTAGSTPGMHGKGENDERRARRAHGRCTGKGVHGERAGVPPSRTGSRRGCGGAGRPSPPPGVRDPRALGAAPALSVPAEREGGARGAAGRGSRPAPGRGSRPRSLGECQSGLGQPSWAPKGSWALKARRQRGFIISPLSAVAGRGFVQPQGCRAGF